MNTNELVLLLKSSTSIDKINDRREEIAESFPFVRDMFDYNQNNDAHPYDLWWHSLHTVRQLRMTPNNGDSALFLAALFHDIGKPAVRTSKPNGQYTFPGHAQESMRTVSLMGLDLPDKEMERLLWYIEHHDDNWNCPRYLLWTVALEYKWRGVPFYMFDNLMALELADAYAHDKEHPKVKERLIRCGMLKYEYGRKIYRF